MRESLAEYCRRTEKLALLDEWDAEKNLPLTPETVSYGSKKKVWWRCAHGHSWQASVYTRTGSGTGCPFCAGKRVVPGENDLASRYPYLAQEWHPEKNGSLTPDQVLPGTHKVVWWRCEHGHEWQAQVKSRVAGAGCPICTTRFLQPGENDLATRYPDIARQWHPEKNGTLTPRDVAPGSNRKVWWRCEHGHEWKATIASRTSGGTGCPVCSGKVALPGENDLVTCFPDIARQWHPEKNGTLTPDHVTPASNRKVWWRCPLGHDYQAVISSRTMRGGGCPYCAGKKVLPGFNDLATVAPDIASQWHPTLNGTLTPRDVTAGSKRKVWWQCKEGHNWQAVVYARAGRGQHTGCPICTGYATGKRREHYEAMQERAKKASMAPKKTQPSQQFMREAVDIERFERSTLDEKIMK